jgi:LacI family transcriptional regulator
MPDVVATSSDAVRARPTLRDVALLAGVSPKTVSRVVNGEAGVSAPTTHLVPTRLIARGSGEIGGPHSG